MRAFLKRNKKEVILASINIILVILILLVFILSNYSPVLFGRKELMFSNENVQLWDFNGKYITFHEYYNDDNRPPKLKLFNIRTKSFSIISEITNIALLDEDYIVYQYSEDARNNYDSSLNLYQISTGDEFRLDNNVRHSLYAIHNNKIVWVKGSYDIYIYDIHTEKSSKVSYEDEHDTIWDIDIHKNLVVFFATGSNDYDKIFVYDISKDRIIDSIETLTSGISSLQISGNRIGWKEWSAGYFLYDMDDKIKKEIPDSNFLSSIDLFEDNLVYVKDGDSEIFIYTISSENERVIDVGGDVRSLMVFGNRIVYYDNDDDSIYRYTFTTKKSTINLIIVVISILLFIIISIKLIRIRLKKRKQLIEENHLKSNNNQSQENDHGLILRTIECPKCKKTLKTNIDKKSSLVECPHCKVKGKIT